MLRYGGIPPYRETRGLRPEDPGPARAAASPHPAATAGDRSSRRATARRRRPRPRARARSAAQARRRPGPRTYYRWNDDAGRPARGRDAARRGRRLLHDPRPRLTSAAMRDPIPRGPFRPGPVPHPLQQGQGALRRAALRGGRAASSRRPTSCGPRDQKVLNLLGLVYFKQDKFEKAEEVYRKLVAESPEAHTLYYNLGLIYFKLEPPRGRGVGLPEGPRARRGQPQDQLLPGLDLRAAAPLQGRDLPVPAGRAPTSWCGASRTRWPRTGPPARALQRRAGRRRAPGRHRRVPGAARSRRPSAGAPRTTARSLTSPQQGRCSRSAPP